MLVISDDFKSAMKQPVKELQAFIESNGVDIRDDDLISYKLSGEGGLCKTVMRKFESNYLGDHNLLGQWATAGFGVKLPSGAYDYVNFGSFKITEFSTAKDTDVTSVVGYDKMINAMVPYKAIDENYDDSSFSYDISDSYVSFPNQISMFSGRYTITSINAEQDPAYVWVETDKAPFVFGYEYHSEEIINALKVGVYFDIVGVNDGASFTIESFIITDKSIPTGQPLYPIDLYTYTKILCKACDLELGNTEFTVNGDLVVEQELFSNIDGITYRDIFTQIAQATATTCIVGNDDKIYFKPVFDTGEVLTYDNLLKFKIEAIYGEINSVILSRTPQEDNIFLKDDNSIALNGLTEFKIENNQFLDKDREKYIEPIFNALKGLSYYPFEVTTEGLGWYEIGDGFTILNSETGDSYPTVLYNFNITVDGSLKETLKTVAETKTQTQYQYATSISKRVKNTELIVNKQEGDIELLVSDMYNVDGLVNENFTKIKQDIQNITASVQNSGGNNLIKNSVMFAYDTNGVPTDWVVNGDGELVINSDTEALRNGGLSGHGFTLKGETVRQRVEVKANDENDANKVYYTFSTKIKKDATGECYVKIYNSQEEYIIPLHAGESAYYSDFELKGLLPKENYYDIEFYADVEANAFFTDNMLALGENKTQWTQANGEVMNTQVNVNINGVLVKSSVYIGDYTVMSPLEFAGYSNVNGTATKVFTLNKDITWVRKLEAVDEVGMVPLKVIPIITGDLQGWAFVPKVEV